MGHNPTPVIDVEPAPVAGQASRHGRRSRRSLVGGAVMVAVLVLLAGVVALRSAGRDGGFGADLSGVSLPAPVAAVSTDTDGFRLWFGTADGKRQVPVTDFYPEATALGAAWSPDGTQVAFHNGTSLMVVNADGSDLRALPGPGGSDPAWSPDGRRIAFTRSDGSGPDIYVMNLDGSGLTRLGVGRRPAWSPDGRRIAFDHTASASAGRPLYQVGVMNADGSGWALLPVVQWKGTTVSVSESAWSPDGQWLVFDGSPMVDPGAQGLPWTGIFRARPDGSDVQQLVRRESSSHDFQGTSGPAWSPDGRWIAYAANDGGIRLVDPDSGEELDLAAGQRDAQGRGPQDLDVSWSPDGTRMAFFRFGDRYQPTP